jgi:hypothetical protein
MRLHRALNFKFALLLALLLPLQAFASVSVASCPQLGAPHETETHCEHGATAHGAATHDAAALQHHNCGTCCCVAAIGSAPPRWVAPRSDAPTVSMPMFHTPPSVTLDRLDRPPRIALG